MQFTDLSPPATPTLDQQTDALRKGLGRAVQWAKSGVLASEPLLNACLIEQRYDMQCEGSRADWLWSLIQITRQVDRFRDPILSALRNISEERDSYQLCELALHFAKAGDKTVLDQLYDLVARKPFPDPDIGRTELLELGGETAFRFAMRLRGAQIATEGWEWDDDSLIYEAVQIFGEARVNEILEESTDQVRCFGFFGQCDNLFWTTGGELSDVEEEFGEAVIEGCDEASPLYGRVQSRCGSDAV